MKRKNPIPAGLTKDNDVKKLADEFMDKARSTLEVMNILSELKTNHDVKKILKLPENRTLDEWVIITAYYAMYHAATALLAKIGYKSKQHAATIKGLGHFFVRKKLMEPQYLDMIEKAHFTNGEISKLSKARERRETAQYDVTKSVTGDLAEISKKNAYDFVNKIQLLLV